jgi:CRISPR-associated endonuclease/helicase Cas3
MFCNAINFLVEQCGSSVVLCTATQPLFGKVDKEKGALKLSEENEIIPDVSQLFSDLKRVDVIDKRKTAGWHDEEIAELAIDETRKTGSCLVIVNMKQSARSVFHVVKKNIGSYSYEIKCFHLSTSMCPHHRKKVLRRIKRRLLTGYPTICVSTQLIEAGVDIDFGAVIRFNAGLDSIAQAAGRCNRNDSRDTGHVYIVNPAEEKIKYLKEIAVGQEKTKRVLNDFSNAPDKYQNNCIGLDLLEWYYENFFYDRKSEMSYPVPSERAGRDDTLLELLSTNSLATGEYARTHKKMPDIFLRQSFMMAAELFHAIDAPTQSVIVRFGDGGKETVEQLCAAFNVKKQYRLIRKAQQYTVNLFPNEFKKLSDADVLRPVQPETEIWFLIDNRYYSDDFGIVTEPMGTSAEEFLYV